MGRGKQRGYPYRSLAKPSILGKLGSRCKASDQVVIQGMNPKMNPPTKRIAHCANPNENSLAKRLQRKKDDRVQRDADDHESEKREEAKDAPSPKHGKRLFIQASLFWQNEMHGGHKKRGVRGRP
jgi:hypothetical protein